MSLNASALMPLTAYRLGVDFFSLRQQLTPLRGAEDQYPASLVRGSQVSILIFFIILNLCHPRLWPAEVVVVEAYNQSPTIAVSFLLADPESEYWNGFDR